MNSGDISRFERAWEEAVKAQDNRGWGRIRRIWRRLRSHYAGGTLPEYRKKKDSQLIQISPAKVMTRDGHILTIDPRCKHCREFFGE